MNYSIDIPELFYSSSENEPIHTCANCGKELFFDNEPYFIEKAFKRNSNAKTVEVIFEYAMCFRCQQSTSQELSVESLKNIKMYFDLYVDFDKRQRDYMNQTNFKLSDCLKQCIITQKPLEYYSEYQIGGYFFRDKLLMDNLPFAIGQQAVEEIQDLISDKTRDFLDGFKDKIFPIDIRDKIPDDFLILL